MLSRLLLGCALAASAMAQAPASQIDLANLREDVRSLTQRVGDLTLRIEQLERENAELKVKSGASERNYVTLAQLNDAIADVSRDLKAAVAGAKMETLQQVATQMEKLANQTNAALESLAKAQTPHLAPLSAASTLPPSAASLSESHAKDGSQYIVQKGDTLAVIAKKTGVKQSEIIAANKLADPSHITVGETLFIPSSSGK